MSIRVALHHKTVYLYDQLIQLTPHLVRLRPAPHTRTPVHRYSLRVEPQDHYIHWQQDPFGNHVASFTFREKTRRFSVEVDLVVQILRNLGLAARFVSGYLVQLAPDVKSLDGPSDPEQDFTDLHAWCEVFLPGAGWVGLDPTSGLFAGEGHIPLA